jgi:leucine dehydrogenase
MMSLDSLITNEIGATSQQDFLDYALAHGFGDIYFHVDEKIGLKAIIVIHNTNLGPALGGCRFLPYSNSTSATYDAMRLAQGMSYKAALADLPLGGGKAVIIEPTTPYDRIAYLRSFGTFIETLKGRYITALDSGTQLADMDIIAEHTSHVASLSKYDGDPSPSTAEGVFQGIKAAVAFKLGKSNLEGLHIAIQGLGHVGYALAHSLTEAGVRLSVADVNPARVKQVVEECGAQAYPADVIHELSCDVFSPCALGAIINDHTIPQLQTTIIAGAANNQLAHTHHGQRLHDQGILYAPDYVINAGGLIYAASKYLHTSEAQVTSQIDTIGNTLKQIFSRSQQEKVPPNIIADTMAKEKLER